MALYVEAAFDLADLGDYELDVVETGGGDATFTATVADDRYFLRTDGAAAIGDLADEVADIDDFLGALETQLNAGTGGGAYTVSFSTTTERVTVAHNGGGGVTAVSLTPTSNGGIIGQTAMKSGALSHAMDRTPDYWIASDIGYWSDYDEREADEIGATVRAHSGRPHGLAFEGVAELLDLLVPLEPRAKVYTHLASSSDPWTWRDLHRHARNVLPLCIDDDDFLHFVVLTEQGASFKPIRVSRDYVGHYDIRLRTQLLGRVAS